MISAVRWAIVLLASMPAPAAAQAHASADRLIVRDAWVRESTAVRTTSGGYCTIENRTEAPVTLLRVRVDGVGDTEIHTTVERDGQASMRPLPGVEIPARGAVALAPGGTHLMLMNIATPLRAGTFVTMTLTFDNKQTRQVRAAVRPLSATSAR